MPGLARKPVPLGFSLTAGRSKAAGMGGMCNFYAEPVKNEGRTSVALYPTPGTSLFSGGGGTEVRGQLDFADLHFAVIGTRLFQIAADGTRTDRGEVEGAGRVRMDYNGAQLVITGSVKVYAYTVSTSMLSEIVDPDLRGLPSDVASLNGYSIFIFPGTDTFQWSALRDATSLDGLSFATAERNADANVAVRIRGNDVLFFGKKTVEFYYDSGNPDQIFESRNIRPLDIGNLSRDATILCDGDYCLLGRDGGAGGQGVYRLTGYVASKISPPAVDKILEDIVAGNPSFDFSTCSALPYQFHGHLCYALTLGKAFTVVFDLAGQNWFYQVSGQYPMSADPGGVWDAVSYAQNGNNRIVGASDGNLYKLDGSVYTEAGNAIVREVTCAQLRYGGNGAIMHRLWLDCEMGVGLTSGQGADPKWQASWSDDGGRTWSGPREATMGKKGETTKRAFWTLCGKFRNRIVKFRTTDPVFATAFSAYADIEPLAA